jgi:hypothetical protein
MPEKPPQSADDESTQDTLVDKRERGFYIVDDEIIDEHGAKLGPLGVAVYNVLVKHANKHGTSSFPSYQTIADKLGITRNSAIKGVKILLEEKVVGKRSRTNESGAPTSNAYRILPVKKRPKEAAEVVQNLHHHPEIPSAYSALPSASDALPLVQNMHQGSANFAPELDSFNQTPLNQTHTLPPAAARGCACLSPHASRFCFDERAAHAEANGLGDGWLHVSAAGTYDDLIERARRRKSPAAVETSLRAPTRHRVTLREAMLHVKSVLDVNAQTDVEGLIQSLDVDDTVRAELRARAPSLLDAARAAVMTVSH